MLHVLLTNLLLLYLKKLIRTIQLLSLSSEIQMHVAYFDKILMVILFKMRVACFLKYLLLFYLKCMLHIWLKHLLLLCLKKEQISCCLYLKNCFIQNIVVICKVLKPNQTGQSDQLNWEPEASPVRKKMLKIGQNQEKLVKNLEKLGTESKSGFAPGSVFKTIIW